MDLAEHGLVLHPFQPYPELEGFWSFTELLANGWSAASITYASVRANQNVVDFQLSLRVGDSGRITEDWPHVLRPHANTERIVTINRQNYGIRFTTQGVVLLLNWTHSLRGELLIGDFSIPRRAA